MAELVGDWGGGRIWRVAGGIPKANSYFCEAKVPGGCILIDAGLDGGLIDRELVKFGLYPYKVFCTHGHFDHIGSASYFQDKYGSEVIVHKLDERTLRASNFLLMALGIKIKIKLPEVTYIEDGYQEKIGDHLLSYIPSPGHTPGSCVVELGNIWFTGDTIYSQGVGLSPLAGANTEILRQTIKKLWSGLNESRTICPGHGDFERGAVIRQNNKPLKKFLELG